MNKRPYFRWLNINTAGVLAALMLLLAGLAKNAPAQRAGLAFLKIGVDARAMAVGNAYTALAQGPTALYWNPAGLAQGSGLAVFIHHNQWLFGSSSEFLALQSTTRSGGWGVYAHSFFVDGIEVRTAATPEPLAETNALFFAVGGGYARRISDRLMVGGAVKYLYQKIYVEQAGGWAVDGGMQYRLRDNVQLGAAVQHVGNMAVLDAEATPLPVTGRVGAVWAWATPSGTWSGVVTADAVAIQGQKPGASVGTEVVFARQLALRAGLLFGYDSRRWTAGVGFVKQRLQIHYALVPFTANLGVTHQFSLVVVL